MSVGCKQEGALTPLVDHPYVVSLTRTENTMYHRQHRPPYAGWAGVVWHISNAGTATRRANSFFCLDSV